MSSAQKDSLTASKSGLKPSILNDTSGPYIVVTCGSFKNLPVNSISLS